MKNSPALPPPSANTDQPDPKLLQAICRAHAWLRDLQNNKFESVAALAASVKLHPKVVRQELPPCVSSAGYYRGDFGGRPANNTLTRPDSEDSSLYLVRAVPCHGALIGIAHPMYGI